MIEPIEAALPLAATLFTVTNPLGNMAVYAGMTGHLTREEQHATAWHAALAITIVMVAILWAGHYILAFFGVSIPALEVAGGIIILHLGLSMLQNKSSGQAQSPAERRAAVEKESLAIVPIAIPIVAGPGAIAAISLHAAQHQGDWAAMLALTVVCAGFGLLFGVCFRWASAASRAVGVHGIAIVTRVMGILLAALACSMIASGAKVLLPGLAGP